MHALLQVLFEKHRFRQSPFEWVYDGLSPVLLPDVVESRKGLSIVLAAIYVMVAKELGVRLTMAPLPQAAAVDLSGQKSQVKKRPPRHPPVHAWKPIRCH